MAISATKSILKQGKSYTFSDYFELNHLIKDILAEFDYGYRLTNLTLPSKPFEGTLDPLRQSYYKKLPRISLNSEIARREVLIAPLLLELMEYTDIDINIEYAINVNERLKGSIDYFIHSNHHLVVIEAKKSDLDRGFTQLAIELIAIEQLTDSKDPFIYGAVTVGDIWRFGRLDRSKRIIHQDIHSFRVPEDLERLFEIMIGILEP